MSKKKEWPDRCLRRIKSVRNLEIIEFGAGDILRNSVVVKIEERYNKE